MPVIDYRQTAPKQERLNEHSELVYESFRSENACEEEPPFYIVHLTDDPDGPTRLCARHQLLDTTASAIDARTIW